MVTKFDSRTPPAAAEITRAAAAHPSSASNVNVIVTEIVGEVFSGSSALTVTIRNSHGTDKKRSALPMAMDRQRPPK